MATVTHDLDVCTVCIHLIANGEYDDGTDAAEKCSAGQVAKWGDLAVHMVLGDTEDTWFSMRDCEGCGDTDGGDRFHAHIIQ